MPVEYTRSGFAEVNGTRLYYAMAGSDPPLVFIHGFSLDRRMWDDQFAVFARRHQVISYDLRGFGKSALPNGESYQHEADLKALLDYLGIERADLVGLSLGGMVAIDFALVYLQSVHALVLVDALFAGYKWSAEWDARTGLVWEIAAKDGIAAAKQLWLDHPLFEPIRERPQAASRLSQMTEDYSGWHFVNDNPAASPEPPAAERLHEINARTLAVVGERDLPDFHHMAAAIEQQVSGARKVVLPAVGHMTNMEDAQGFNDAVLRFLADV
jgi:pimeloyl-ACP methyl ester carboxylesterase